PVPPRQLNARVPRDLETICLKCLEKSPGRRYASAAELADDLRRSLNGEPIKARTLGWVERGGRWLKRNGRRAAGRAAMFLRLAMALLAYFNVRPGAPPTPPSRGGFKGLLLPVQRRWVFPPTEARVVRFEVVSGQQVSPGQTLAVLHDSGLQRK